MGLQKTLPLRMNFWESNPRELNLSGRSIMGGNYSLVLFTKMEVSF